MYNETVHGVGYSTHVGYLSYVRLQIQLLQEDVIRILSRCAEYKMFSVVPCFQ